MMTKRNRITGIAGRFFLLLSGLSANAIELPVPGTLDPDFNPGAGEDTVATLAVQPDRKILLGGAFKKADSSFLTGTARIGLNGTPEAAAAYNPFAEFFSEVYCVAVQTDGRIVAGGRFGGGQYHHDITRLNPDGTLDFTFDFNAGRNSTGNMVSPSAALAILPDGKILVAGGDSGIVGRLETGLVRLNADGTADAAGFSSVSADRTIQCIAVQADGRIVIGGAFTLINGLSRRGIARLSADGVIESASTFKIGTGANDMVTSIAIQPDGRILLGGGFSSFDGQPRNGLARLSPDGTLESTAAFHPDTINKYTVFNIALQADAKILISGFLSTVNNNEIPGIARLLPNGDVESAASFNTGSGINFPPAMALEANGGILLGGEFRSVNGTSRNHLARLLNGPALDILRVPNQQRLLWKRGGAAPEIEQVTFELATDGKHWTALGPGVRLAGAWECTGLNLPVAGQIRARGRTVSGNGNGSTGLVQAIQPFAFTATPPLPAPAATPDFPAPVAWGRGVNGQMGDGTTVTRPTPGLVDTNGVLSGKDIVSVAAGEGHAIALTTEGRAYTWGYNFFGQSGDGSPLTNRPRPVPVDTNGVLAGKTITKVRAGLHHCLVLTFDGKLYSWGHNDSYVLGDGTATQRNRPIAVNMSGVLAGKTVKAIAAGYLHNLVLTTEGKLYAWGENSSGQLGDSSFTTRSLPVAVTVPAVLAGRTIVDVCAGREHSLALASDGRLFAWGLNSSGQLGDGSTTNRNVPVAVNAGGVLAGQSIIAVDAGYGQTLALSSANRLYAWGRNNKGQLGDGTTNDRLVPVAVDMSIDLSGRTPLSIAAGRDHCLVLGDDGYAYGWGDNTYGQLGSDTVPLLTSPGQIEANGALAGRQVRFIDAGTGFNTVLTVPGPDAESHITVEQPAGTGLADNGAVVDFGPAVTGTNAVRAFKIRNEGVAALHLGSVTLSGDDADDFAFNAFPAFTVATGGSTEFELRFNATVPGIRTATLHLTSDDPGQNNFDIALTARSISLLENWRQNHFGTIEDEGDAANHSDPDHDGLENLVEFAFALNPVQPQAAGLPVWQQTGDHFVLNFTHPANVAGISFSAESSPTLDSGSWTPIPNSASVPNYTFYAPTGSGRRLYLRLRVSAP